MGSVAAVLGWLKLMAGVGKPNRTALMFTACYVLVVMLSFYTAYGPDRTCFLYDASHRYFLTPSIFMVWALLIHAQSAPRLSYRRLYRILTGWIMLLDAVMWLSTLPASYADDAYFYPASWQAEVDLWRKDPAHPLKIAPAGWEIMLQPPAL